MIRSHFDEVKAIANQIQEDWKSLLIDCFPKILVNILPYFAYEGTADGGMAQQRETAAVVYDTLKSESFLGKQVCFNVTYFLFSNTWFKFYIFRFLVIIYITEVSLW